MGNARSLVPAADDFLRHQRHRHLEGHQGVTPRDPQDGIHAHEELRRPGNGAALAARRLPVVAGAFGTATLEQMTCHTPEPIGTKHRINQQTGEAYTAAMQKPCYWCKHVDNKRKDVSQRCTHPICHGNAYHVGKKGCFSKHIIYGEPERHAWKRMRVASSDAGQ
mmetsp:Transcript_63383/g.150231  ORF Transcript_63383/g.150231 Transcript_63383/m.150231 type:complete len:165 (-) Transcript_63383:29-523(-)